MLQRTVILHVHPTPAELAFEFSIMKDDEQAEFFSELAVLVSKWDGPFCFQLQALIDNPALTDSGRRLMQEIGEYGESITSELAVAAERDACARLCEQNKWEGHSSPEDGNAAHYWEEAARDCADQIRNRANTGGGANNTGRQSAASSPL